MNLWNHQFPKNQPKKLKDFCREFFIVHRAEILQIFWFIFWKIDDFINPFWLNLTFRKFNCLQLALELIRYLLKPSKTCPVEHTFSVWMDPETASKSFSLDLIRRNRNCTEILQYVHVFLCLICWKYQFFGGVPYEYVRQIMVSGHLTNVPGFVFLSQSLKQN